MGRGSSDRTATATPLLGTARQRGTAQPCGTARRRGIAHLLGTACLLTLTIGCTGSETSGNTTTTAPERFSEPPVDLSWSRIASMGERLVAVDDRADEAAIRDPDGTWTELPTIEQEGVWHYTSVGPIVVAGGYTCDNGREDQSCRGVVALYRLEPDLSGWTRLDVPHAEATSDTELTASIGPQQVGDFSIGPLRLLVDADGRVRTGDRGPDDRRHGGSECKVGDTLVSIGWGPEEDLTLPVPVVEQVDTLMLAEPDAAWQPIEPVPPAIQNWVGNRICGSEHMSILPREGSTEWVVDLTTRSIRPVESNTLEMVQNPGHMWPGETAIGPEGSVFVVNSGGRTVRRQGLGPWQELSLELSAVYATPSTVWGVDPRANDVVELT